MDYKGTIRNDIDGVVMRVDDTATATYIGRWNTTSNKGVEDPSKPYWRIRRVLKSGSKQVVDYPLNNKNSYDENYAFIRDNRTTLNWATSTP